MLGEAFDPVLAAARSGGEWAWQRLYRDLAPAVGGYLRSQGAAEPDDLLGDVFVQIVRNLSSFDGSEAGFRAWVFVIAHHRLIDERRLLAKRREQPMDGVDRPAATDVEREAIGRRGADRVREIIDRLAPDQRDVLLLRIFGELTIEETAQALGKRPGAVKSLQHRGLASVRRLIEREGVSL